MTAAVAPIVSWGRVGARPLRTSASDVVRRTRLASGVQARHGPTVIVVVAPRIDDRLRVGDGFEAVQLRHSSRSRPLKLSINVLHRLAGPNEIQRDATPVGPFVERLGREFGA